MAPQQIGDVDTAETTTITLNDGKDRVVPKVIDVQGEDIELNLSDFLTLCGSWETRVAKAVMTKFKALAFNWRESQSSGKMVYCSKTLVCASGDTNKSFTQSDLEKLGIVFPAPGAKVTLGT